MSRLSRIIIVLDKVDMHMLKRHLIWEFLINRATPNGEFLGSLKRGNDIWSALRLSMWGSWAVAGPVW